MQKKYPPLDLVAPAVFAIVFIVTLIYSRFEPNVEDVDMAYVRAHGREPGYVLVDARSEEAFDGESPRYGIPGGHIPWAVSFPISNLQTSIPLTELARAGITRKNTVIIYCNTGVLAGRFADQLVRRFNFSASKLKNYRGSVQDWVKYPGNVLEPEDHETGYEEKFLGR